MDQRSIPRAASAATSSGLSMARPRSQKIDPRDQQVMSPRVPDAVSVIAVEDARKRAYGGASPRHGAPLTSGQALEPWVRDQVSWGKWRLPDGKPQRRQWRRPMSHPSIFALAVIAAVGLAVTAADQASAGGSRYGAGYTAYGGLDSPSKRLVTRRLVTPRQCFRSCRAPPPLPLNLCRRECHCPRCGRAT